MVGGGGKGTGMGTSYGGGGKGYIAVHIRRGDVDETGTFASRYTPDATYAALITQLVARHPGLPVVICSQGKRTDFGNCLAADCQGSGAELHWLLDGELRETFHVLVSASALLVARSSLSYCAALLSEGTVYADCLRGWWHAPLPCWVMLLGEEHEAVTAHRRARDEEWRRAWGA